MAEANEGASTLEDARHELCDAATVGVGRLADAGRSEEAKRLKLAVFAFIEAADAEIARLRDLGLDGVDREEDLKRDLAAARTELDSSRKRRN